MSPVGAMDRGAPLVRDSNSRAEGSKPVLECFFPFYKKKRIREEAVHTCVFQCAPFYSRL